MAVTYVTYVYESQLAGDENSTERMTRNTQIALAEQSRTEYDTRTLTIIITERVLKYLKAVWYEPSVIIVCYYCIIEYSDVREYINCIYIDAKRNIDN